jgi:hypothetical protein
MILFQYADCILLHTAIYTAIYPASSYCSCAYAQEQYEDAGYIAVYIDFYAVV